MTTPDQLSARRQLNALAKDVADIKRDVARILSALAVKPLEEDRTQAAQAAMRERHQRPTCETCNSVGMVETSAGAIPCEECSA